MVDYWLDSDSLMRSKDGVLAFDLAPTFWRFIEDLIASGNCGLTDEIYKEMADAKFPDGTQDTLADWLRSRAHLAYPIATPNVQERYREIADYVNDNFKPRQRARFLDRADGWLIAHAAALGGTVVSEETWDLNQPKIPVVCAYFKVRAIHLHEMLQELGVSFELHRD